MGKPHSIYYKGQIIGKRTETGTPTNKFSGKPTLVKPTNSYSQGSWSNIFVLQETGVAKDAYAAATTATTNGLASNPNGNKVF